METLLRLIKRSIYAKKIDLFVVGGAVRDRGLLRQSIDIDFATPGDGFLLCKEIARELGASFVALDEEERVARLVSRGLILDFASFKDNATTLEGDLGRRDFTINSMALTLDDWLETSDLSCAVDPYNGRLDLQEKIVRLTYTDAVLDDPLRMIRGYRLLSLAGFRLDASFIDQVILHKSKISAVSVERILSELHLIMLADFSGSIISQMADSGLLAEILSELTSGAGVAQPASHHLDVFDHNLEALRRMDQIIKNPGQFFPGSEAIFEKYLEKPHRILWLKWAALCHDIGKPLTAREINGKITFYHHDQKGARLFRDMARRLTFSNRDIDGIFLFISQHMRPFFLCNNLREGGVSTRACLRLAKAVGDDLPGLFMVAMADSLAGKGEKKPENMEEELCELFNRVHATIEEKIRPVLSGPPLLTGKDLIQEGFAPGPVFKEILEEAEQLHVDGVLVRKDDALVWLKRNYKQ